MQSLDKKSMEPCKIPEFWEILTCFVQCVSALMLQYYFTISENLYLALCLHLIDYMYFFRILPVLFQFLPEETGRIPFSSFFHSRWKKPISSGSFQTLLCCSELLWAFIFDYLKLITRVPLQAQRINFSFIRKYLFPLRRPTAAESADHMTWNVILT